MQNRVSILAFDQDNITIAGSAGTISVNTNARLNGYFQSDLANGSQYSYIRYFPKGGNYKIRLIYVKDSNKAKYDIGVDSTSDVSIVSQLDAYNVSTLWNVVYETTREFSRGYHTIYFKANGKNASSSTYSLVFTALEFDLIQEYPVYQDDRPAQINQGSMVLLGKHTAVVVEPSFTFNLADLDMSKKYSELVVEINGSTTASLALQCLINGIASGYYYDGWKDLTGTLTGVNFAADTKYEIIGTNIIAAAVSNLRVVMRISVPNQIANIISHAGVGAAGTTNLQGGAGISSNNITSIQIKTSTSTWAIGTTIEVYGVRKV